MTGVSINSESKYIVRIKDVKTTLKSDSPRSASRYGLKQLAKKKNLVGENKEKADVVEFTVEDVKINMKFEYIGRVWYSSEKQDCVEVVVELVNIIEKN